MFGDLKKAVCEANLDLAYRGLVLMTWGNVSAIDADRMHIVIKPSGLPYEKMKPRDMVVVDLDGKTVDGELKPSVDLPTHLSLYKAMPNIFGIAHSHSHFATVWAQACRPIPCLGTTHADYFAGEVPVTDGLSENEIRDEYERAIGASIIRCIGERDPLTCPAALVANHAPFTWGESPAKAVENAIVLEEIARMAFDTVTLQPSIRPIPHHLLNCHFARKHGQDSYYGQ